MKKIMTFFLMWLFVTNFSFAQEKVLKIDISGISEKKIPLAITMFKNVSKDNQIKEAKELDKIITNDLALTNWFKIINKKAFLHAPAKYGFRTKEVPFASWESLDVTHLVKGSYEIKGKKINIVAYVYDVVSRKLLLKTPSYSGKISTIRKISHKIANKIVEVITGDKGIFETKIVCVAEITEKISKGKRQRVVKYKDIIAMDFDGENETFLTRSKALLFSPKWSYDGKQIVFTAKKGEFQDLYIRYSNGKEAHVKQITFGEKMVLSPVFSPVSNDLAATFYDEKRDNFEIFLIDRKGKKKEQLTFNWNIDNAPSFSPNGKKIVFCSKQTGIRQLYIVDIESKKQERIIFNEVYNDTPSWSPKGDKIAFAGQDTDGESDIFVLDITKKPYDIKRLTWDSRNNEYPSWSPDGRFIAFTSNRTGKYNIYIMNKDGRNQRRLTYGNYEYIMPHLSPRLN